MSCPLIPALLLGPLLALAAMPSVAAKAAPSSPSEGAESQAGSPAAASQQDAPVSEAAAEASPAQQETGIAEAVAVGKVLKDMTMEQVRQARGEPNRKEVIPPDAELWHYHEGEVAFSAGKVSYASLAPRTKQEGRGLTQITEPSNDMAQPIASSTTADSAGERVAPGAENRSSATNRGYSVPKLRAIKLEASKLELPQARGIDTQAAAVALEREAAQLEAVLEMAQSQWEGESEASGGARWPMQVRILSADRATKKISGEVEWPTLHSVNKVTGAIVGSTLVFTEVDYIRKGQAILGCTYTLEAGSEESLSGRYECGTGESGSTNLVLK